MVEKTCDIYLRRIDPSQNMARYYALSIQPNLFGGSSVVREWGRIGSRGQCKVELLDDLANAEKVRDRIERLKRRRGYAEVAQATVAVSLLIMAAE